MEMAKFVEAVALWGNKAKILAELPRERVYMRALRSAITTDSKLQEVIRHTQPNQKDREKLQADIKSYGLLYSIQAFISADSPLQICCFEGHGRLAAYADHDYVELTVHLTMSRELAIHRAASANHLRSDADEDDIFALLETLSDGDVAKVTGSHAKTVSRYKAVRDAGLKRFVQHQYITLKFALELIDLAGNDKEKLPKICSAMCEQAAFADEKIKDEHAAANKEGRTAKKDITEKDFYFPNALLAQWKSDFIEGVSLKTCVLLNDRKHSITADEKQWEKRIIPKVGIEGRALAELSDAALGSELQDFVDRLLDEAQIELANRQSRRLRQKHRQKPQPLGTVVEEPSPVIKRQTLPIMAEGVGAGENPSQDIIDAAQGESDADETSN